MAIQLIRLSQIKSSLSQFMDFEQQLIAMYGSDDLLKFIANEGQQTFILDRDYVVGKNSIKVFVNGLLQNVNESYTEVNSRMISFTDALVKDDAVTIIFNNFNRFAQQLGHERAKVYQIFRQSYFITEDNKTTLTFEAPVQYQIGLNQLKVYVNGLLLSCGPSFGYVENTDKTFTLNKTLTVGDTLTAEVITGGLMVYKCNRYPIFIDNSKTTQRNIIVSTPYKVGSNNLKVYLNGQLLRPGVDNDYVETNSTSFNMNYDLPLGSIIEAEITTFTVDVFTISRSSRIITADNATNMNFTTIPSYNMGETNLRVYMNGVLLREGVNEDYVEVSESSFKLNYTSLPLKTIIEYEIITW